MKEGPVLIDHLDLASGAIPALSRPSGAAGRLLFFWWREIPVGMAQIPSVLLPMPAAAVREVVLDSITPAVASTLSEDDSRSGDPLVRLEERVRELEAASIERSISLVICTRDRPEDLRLCLASLANIDHEADEVIVVDNAPQTDGTRRVVETCTAPKVHYVLEPRPGLSAARNAGLRASRGELVAFTDDDVEVHPKFLTRLCGGLADPDVMAVTGNVIPAELKTEAQRLFQWNYGILGFGFSSITYDATFLERTHRKGSPVWEIGMGANMAFRREIFDRVGGFDERLGAGASGCSEDSEMWYRILSAGWRCRYEPTTVVYHRHRRTIASLRSQLYAYMRGHVAALCVQYERHGHLGNLRRAFISLPRYWGRWGLRRALGRRDGPSMVGTQALGSAAGIAYYLRHRKDSGAPELRTLS